MKRAFDFLGITSRATTRRDAYITEDPTDYIIKTYEQDYLGKIMFQDNKLILLKTGDLKVVKILKGSIQKIK